MKIIVVSDNHYDDEVLEKIFEREEADLWIHCGDSQMDVQDELMKRFIGVKGNTDYAPFLKEQIIGVKRNKILVSHGHLYNIDYTTHAIVESAKIQGARLVLHGHTHIPRDITVDGVRIINPGSTSWPRGGFNFGSYAIIDAMSDDVAAWNVIFVSTKTWSEVTL